MKCNLAVLVHWTMKATIQMQGVKKVTGRMAFIARKQVQRQVCPTAMYKVLVREHFEYCVKLWFTSLSREQQDPDSIFGEKEWVPLSYSRNHSEIT